MKNLYAFPSCKFLSQLPKTIIVLVLCLTSVSFNSFSQNNETKIEESYRSYFNAERETIYLHFNKQTFLLNESIWFKGYIYDKKGNIPFVTTSNIYVSLYDKDGNIVKTKLYYAENGTFKGHFKVTKDLASGFYVFKAHTNWMKNFSEDESFTSEPIQIMNPSSETYNAPENASPTFDLQFLPEGGHCISDVTNSIGYKIVNCEGKGIKIEGSIVNSKNEFIKTFKSNPFGIGKFDLLMLTGETYKAQYTINGKDYETNLPISSPTGFTIATNNYTTENLTYISLKTNTNTLIQESGKIYYLVIHQNNKSSIVNLDVDDLELNNIISIDNKTLPIGVNTITLFNNQLQPLLERMIFNYREGDFIKANVLTTAAAKDSLSVQIHLKDYNKPAYSSNLSVSVLPAQTEAFKSNRNIISASLIDPYINGHLENVDFYFEDINRIKSFHLDLAMLTQGWSKYNWNAIKKGAQDLRIPFDKGVTIKGTLNETMDPDSTYEIQMFSMVNNINEMRSIGNDKTFNFENYFIKDSTKVHFNVLKDGEKITKPKLYARLINKDRTSLNQIFKIPNTCEIDYKAKDDISKYANIKFEGEVLDTVNLSYTKQKEKQNPLKYATADIGNSYSRVIKVDSIQERQHQFIVDIINANGFTAINDAGRVNIYNRRPISLTAGQSPLLFIDGVNFRNDYNILAGMRTSEIDEIYINKSGLGYGVQGGAGVIRIYLKKDLGVLSDNSLARYANSLLVNGGFADQKEFYSPLFYDKSSSLFESYGAIDWQPELISDKNGTVTFKMKNTGISTLLFIIEGFSVNGKLISEVKEVSINKSINN